MPRSTKVKTIRPSDRYAAMTQAEYDAEAAQFEPPNEVVGTPLAAGEWEAMKQAAQAERRRRGRPVKPKAQKVARVLVSMPPELLTAIDAAAQKRNMTRAALIAQGMRKLLKLPA